VRTAFHEQLHELTHSIGEMCGVAGSAMHQATQSLLGADIVLAETVISAHHDFVNQVAQAESDAFTLLALQAPVASDLRAVFGSLLNVADVDRMGALALHVAKSARRRHPAHAIPDDVSAYFAKMGRIAVNIGANAKDVVLSGNSDRAAQLDNDDDAMDEIHHHLFTILLGDHWPHPVARAVDVTLLSRYYERFADHAVAVGRRVIFQTTGTQVSSRAARPDPDPPSA
jgi:phosphate transport system protein